MQNSIFLMIWLVLLSIVLSVYFVSSYHGTALATNKNSLASFQNPISMDSKINSVSNLNSTSQSNSSNDSSLVTNNNTDQNLISTENYDKLKNCNEDTDKKPTSNEYLTYFNCGHVLPNNSNTKDNQTIREFTLFIKENSSVPIVSNGLIFSPSWTFNETIPGPTMRVTEGDIVKINVLNSKENNQTHSLHMHSIHPAEMDGVEGQGGFIEPGQNFTYIFKAGPYGIYPYHCHSSPIDQHINKGLYGAFIIDPKIPRPNMTEMVMMMNGYDLDYEKEGIGPSRIPTPEEVIEDYMPQEFEHGNEVYTVNGKAFDYMENPIQIYQNTNYRIYLLNMLEFDQVNSFHLHGNVFKYYPSGTSIEPSFVNDILTLSQGDRGVVEFSYPYTGNFMFHSHINEFSDLGWMGLFNVAKK
ncbi:multicopper oxidase domain-containing protein [Candidatus Nitrosocosmicus arcticus]|uniref:Copper-containing nitrite reductase n=1 Tax=Candidatus Nitrosocosmicus arcticus TaxID=2035267 RepID=A0A557SW99_9ARCH|nr:multicopper oxidase domain-containing protein [Candidatus Nitrosocosmicus arcticus]TVP40873.1 multicopper oxidase [Candidatus Nitrosocosmicus arcticus]